MVIDIKMCRFDNVPWGFRLVGGADYEYPLTVVKVAEGSIAEEAGLRVEDVIVRINDTAATPLTHDEAHRLILSSGSVFYFGVYRENEEDAYECPKRFPLSSSSLTKSPTPLASPGYDSLSPVPSLTEATKAHIPEQVVAASQAAVTTAVAQAESEVAALQDALECRSAMAEVHSADYNDNNNNNNNNGNNCNNAMDTMDSLYLPDLPDRPCSALSEQTEIKLVEEEIAAVLSGESEVLKEHQVLGIFPKPGVCMTSDVLRSLNEEVTKTKLEKEKENRKWSTFLQRPDRPVPKSKQQLEAERRAANAYKVKIVKSQPREKSPMPELKPAAKEATPTPAEEESKPPTNEQENKQETEAHVQTEEEKEQEELEQEPLPTDSEVPNLEQLPDNGSNNNNNDDYDDKPELPEDNGEQGESSDAEQLEKADASKDEQSDGQEQQEAESEATTPAKTDEELALEKQLADVQKQLAALSSLPSTIQSTLDAVTKQLAELLPTFKLQQQQEQQQGEGEGQKQLPEIDEQQAEEDKLAGGEHEDSGGVCPGVSADDMPQSACENNEDKCDDANDLEVSKISLSNGGDNCALEEQQQQELNEQQSFKKQKKHNVIEELEEHLVRKNNPKRSKRAFGPLTPSSERPLVLPGGRRWYRPKDAYNDEFIAETLSAQAELITGSTLGVNFMKYQKPERKIDLNRSEVYKVIHHLDRAPVRGIEVRAPLVAAESDIRQAVQS
ncbi:SUN domain-containing protein 2 isoform X2 [Drosophila busckii]|uniref:SUN domain-containing protein 2 isoform X2 n=1 Tax=Drosophila busckii TaxID=30019 RepID=UPI00083F32F5|nr:SUN domain-containing protein 2 isoform X2 [Drosophila busckii]